MEHKDLSALEIELAVLQRDVKNYENKKAEVPNWVKNSSAAIILAIFTQTIASVWWASAITANVDNLRKEVRLNTEFRLLFPKMKEDIMIELNKLGSQNSHLSEKIDTIKGIVIGPDSGHNFKITPLTE